MRKLLARTAACAAFAALLVGCSPGQVGTPGQGQSTTPQGAQLAVVTTAKGAEGAKVPPAEPMPACAKPGNAIALPTDFPAQFPFPPGTVISQSQSRTEGRVLNGVAPSDPHSVAVFLSRELPYKGFKTGIGDSEANEAESDYAGYGYQGRWKVRSIQGCPGAVTFTVFAGPVPQPKSP